VTTALSDRSVETDSIEVIEVIAAAIAGAPVNAEAAMIVTMIAPGNATVIATTRYRPKRPLKPRHQPQKKWSSKKNPCARLTIRPRPAPQPSRKRKSARKIQRRVNGNRAAIAFDSRHRMNPRTIAPI